MGRKIDLIFGGSLLLIILGVGFWALLNSNVLGGDRNGGGSGGGSGGGKIFKSSAAQCDGQDDAYIILVGDEKSDLCTCYEQAYACGSSDVNVSSSQYQTGFSACRGSLGKNGGDAWTYGWANGQTYGDRTRSKCQYMLNESAK